MLADVDQEDPGGIFPLPLTAWEEFCFCDDHRNYPAQFACQIEFDGQLDASVARQALQLCAQRHPLFTSWVRLQGRSLCWVPSGNELQLESVRCESDDFELPPLERVDLSQQLPTRAIVVLGKKVSRLVVYFHHCVCDGLGAIQFVIEWVQIYDALVNKVDVRKRVRKLDPRLLAGRGTFSQTTADFMRSLPHQFKSVVATAKLIFQRVQPLVPEERISLAANGRRTKIGFQTKRFTPGQTAQIAQHAAQLRSSMHTLILRDLFLAIEDWLRLSGHCLENSIRIMVPFNEREYADRRLPACNRCSVSPLSRNKSSIADPDQLRQSIERTEHAIHAGRLGLNFHRILNLQRRYLGGLSRMTRSDRISATCLVTNLGKLHTRRLEFLPDKTAICGGKRIKGFDLIAPIRPGMATSLAIFTYADQLNITMHYDSLLLTASQASRLLECLSERLLSDSSPSANQQSNPPRRRSPELVA